MEEVVSEQQDYKGYDVKYQKADESQRGYTFVPGTGFTNHDPEEERRRKLHYVANHVGLAIVFFVLISVFATLPVTLLFSAMGLPVYVNFTSMQVYGAQFMIYLVQIVVSVLKLGVPALFLYSALKCRIRFYGVMKPPRLRTFFYTVPMTLAATVIGSFAAQIVQKLLVMFGWNVSQPNYQTPESEADILLYFILLTIVPAFLEELFFRGAIMQPLRCFGDSIALVVSSLLFALAHFNAMQAVNAMILGLVIGYFVMRTRSLWTGILLHFCVNTVSFFEVMLLNEWAPQNYQMISNMISLVLIAAGIMSFLVFVRREPSAFTIPQLKTTWTVGKRLTVFFSSGGIMIALLLMVYFWVQV